MENKQEILDKIEHCKYVVGTTKNPRCKRDHIKAIHRLEKELKNDRNWFNKTRREKRRK